MSETLGTLALDSGIVTSVGTLDTTTDDCDSLTYVGTTLHLIDVHSPGGVTGLFTVDPGTAATTPVTTFDDDVVRVAWDPSRDLLYGHARVARQLVTIDRATGALTPVGTTHDAVTYADAPFVALEAAPLATCPAP